MAGLTASHRAAAQGLRVGLFDKNFTVAGGLGGFAAFSGAKFSFYPAGRGLLAAAGGQTALVDTYNQVADFLGQHSEPLANRTVTSGSEEPQGEARLRAYESVLLTPGEIELLLAGLTRLPANVDLKQERVHSITGEDGSFTIEGDGWQTRAKKVVVAAGRTGSDLLGRAGCAPQDGKGLDVGLRLEFDDLSQVAPLRAIGPDAKILLGDTRTFCLNAPGEIYHYPAWGLKIPGGVVADAGSISANFGILHRCVSKQRLLADIISRALQIELLDQPIQAWGPTLQDPAIEAMYGAAVAANIERLQVHLHETGLVDFDKGYRIHRPLLDWHWPVYGVGQGFETSVPGIFCVGDASGVARGLLQAATSGWLCVEHLSR